MRKGLTYSLFSFFSVLLSGPATAAGLSHVPTLPPHALLPSGQQCASMIAPEPEVRPQNTPYNQTVPSMFDLVSFHQRPVFGTTLPVSDFAQVDGDYRGTTDMILRWAACKWGIDEDVVRAQAWTESKWRQGGPNPGDGGGDKKTDPKLCMQGNFTALWNYGCPGCCYQSWGILQTKVYYSFGTWPMIKDSTAFNADYRFAEQRSCMNGGQAGYFGSASKRGNTYASDVVSGDTDRVLWGCIGTHFSGGWYDPKAMNYIAETQGYLASKPWLRLAPQ